MVTVVTNNQERRSISMTVGEKLKKLRGCRTASGVARELGISRSALVKYETDIRVPRDEVKKKIAAYYGVSVQSIFFA
jgi:transcriptional regulator with XRE-family HTH domain